tara:strand:- start:177 stop:503 length:327 start_codon:yes stop_codon:yes gene_type:complete
MANYNGGQSFTVPRQIVLKNGVNVETLAGAKTLDKKSSMIQVLNPSGSSRVINLPALKDGMVFWIANSGSGGHDLTVTKPDASTILVSDGKGLMIACDGTQWYQVINA